LCELIGAESGNPRPVPPVMAAAQATQWATLEQLEQLPFPKANIDILRFLRTAGANQCQTL
jgi:hypothetical protein